MPTYEEIKHKCVLNNVLWEDPDFPANSDAILPDLGDKDSYTWKRPKEISKEPPKFIVEGTSRFDLAQGELADCWFISSAAVLATKPALFARVVPSDQGFGADYIGAFKFNFWQFGKWREVVVDDRLPVTIDDSPMFGYNRGQPNEFWGPLLEKAYAKLYGYYYAISEGHLREALVDLTGGLSEAYNLTRPERLPDNLFDIIKKSHENGSLMGAAIWSDKGKTMEEEQNNGLFKGHAYSITGVMEREIRGSSIQLIRLKNPWGRSEWNGAWGDGSAEWKSIPAAEKKKIDLVLDDDGEFWMSFEDMKTHYSMLDMVHLGPTSFAKIDEKSSKWHCVEHHGKWVKGVNAGGNGILTSKKLYYKNPQFFVTLTEPDQEDGQCTMVVSLILKDYRERRVSSAKKNLIVGFDVHQVKSGHPELLDGVTFEEKTALTKQFTTSSGVREATSRLTLSPGTYVIIPTTYKAGQEGPFYLRVFTHLPADSMEFKEETGPIPKEEDKKEEEKEKEQEKVTEPEEEKKERDEEKEQEGEVPKPIPAVAALSREVFAEFAGEDFELDARDLRDMLSSLLRKEDDQAASFSVEACRTLLSTVDTDHYGVIDYRQAVKLWEEVLYWKGLFSKHDIDKSGTIETWELRDVFREVGFSLSFLTISTLAVRYGGKNRTLLFEDFVLCLTRTLSMYMAFKEFSQHSPGEARLDLESWMHTTLSH